MISSMPVLSVSVKRCCGGLWFVAAVGGLTGGFLHMRSFSYIESMEILTRVRKAWRSLESGLRPS